MTNHNISLEWLAGFYEGEGYPYSRTNFVLHIAQKNKQVLEDICEGYGGRIYNNANGTHGWQLSGSRAMHLAFELLKCVHHPEKIEQLTKALILTGHLKPRSDEETKEVVEHQTTVKTIHRADYLANKEERNTYSREYAKTHKEAFKTYNRKRNEQKKLIREYIDTHPETVRELTKGVIT